MRLMNLGVGTVVVRTTYSIWCDGRYETATSFRLLPSQLLLSLGLRKAPELTISTVGLQRRFMLETFRVVPKNPLIFEFCKSGNVHGMELLIARGKASMMDVDPEGRSLFLISVLEGDG
ncbi:hypothetical protein K402DRAFT_388083 [Aulographum hederae CBS 113979]|uniref:Uncharacterized protein n=1 Tax=Aulographum hederae CBS 113979 TaxID=1176131 RepID=A0A6G1HGR8_9PEZI|nr:hypothetical protein K402DRAFT_388083 [Aulographum hederae CBS 113979]